MSNELICFILLTVALLLSLYKVWQVFKILIDEQAADHARRRKALDERIAKRALERLTEE